MRKQRLAAVSCRLLGLVLALLSAAGSPAAERCFAIKVVDEATGRGVPLVELETVHCVSFWTDSGGLVAVDDPDLFGRKVFFHVRSHGYEFPKDGFGYAGRTLAVQPGATAELKIKRINLAERLYRITGEGIYRDTERLGLERPIPPNHGNVAGQDSTMSVRYGDRIYWFWGDTSRLSYPLGNFRSSGATSPLPGSGGFDPVVGIPLTYFTDAEGFCRAMWPKPEGERATLVWPDGFLTAPDDSGRQRLVAHYAHLRSLTDFVEHGIGMFDDQSQQFVRTRPLPKDEQWRFPKGHPIRGRGPLEGYCLFRALRDDHAPLPAVRVKATVAAVADPKSYEAFTCLKTGGGDVERDADGRAAWSWKPGAEPLTQRQESQLVRAGKLREDEARYQVRDVDTRKPVLLHAGSVRWNEFRRNWVMIVGQFGDGKLGEIWFSEAPEATGPWRWAKKIVTHDRQTFYNPVHHELLDQEGGRLVYFEGTYTNDFSGNPVATPRYQYNQIMYRLDLADPRLPPRPARKDGSP